ncbi:MAG: ATP-binding protein [Bacillota bacterium]
MINRAPIVILAKHAIDDAQAIALEQAVTERFRDAGFKVVVVPHLYHVPEPSPLWKRLENQAAGPMVLLSWLHPRPAEWLLRRHDLCTDRLIAFNLKTFVTAEACFAAVQRALADADIAFGAPTPGQVVSLDEPTSQRWYPVVDGSRCVNCQHCLQFCLFGVYALNEAGAVRVQNPDQCKPGCPACSRICPHGAIVFPLYERDEAIAGAPGRFMTPDLAARRMFYSRTRRPCPRCGNIVQPGQASVSTESGEICPECGSRCTPSAPAANPASPVFDDLDVLVDQLDQVMQRRRK